jgi:hypothetical protein
MSRSTRGEAVGAGADGDEARRRELGAAEVAFSVGEAEAARAMAQADPETGAAEWGGTVIGQSRALEALGIGIGVRSRGYNVYVSGAPGTGRRTAVLRVVADASAAGGARPGSSVRDIAYVYNFA